MYSTLDIKEIPGYPNKPPPKYDKNLPRFSDDPCSVVPHILSFVRYVSTFQGRHQNLFIGSFLLYLG
jgi:hypothetical protein